MINDYMLIGALPWPLVVKDGSVGINTVPETDFVDFPGKVKLHIHTGDYNGGIKITAGSGKFAGIWLAHNNANHEMWEMASSYNTYWGNYFTLCDHTAGVGINNDRFILVGAGATSGPYTEGTMVWKADRVIDTWNKPQFQILGETNDLQKLVIGYDTTNDRGVIQAGHGGVGYTGLLLNPFGGNVGIGTTSPGGSSTAGEKVLSIANGTEPVGGVTGQVSLFSKDVTGSAELFAMDAAGNKTQLSSHPTDFLDTLPVEDHPFPWAYRAENEYLGKRINVDLAGLVAAVEKLTGKKFMFIEDIERRDWDADQEIQRLAREEERQRAFAQIADLEQKIALEEDEEKKADLIKQKDAIVIPESYVKKPMPKWMADRVTS